MWPQAFWRELVPFQWMAIVLQLAVFTSWSVTLATDKWPHQLTGDKILRVEALDEGSFRHVEQLLESIIPPEDLDIWRYPDVSNPWLDVYIPHKYLTTITRLLQASEIHYDVMINDVKNLIDEQAHTRVKRVRRDDDETFNVIGRYARLSEIYNWLDYIVTRYPDIASTMYIGDSYEGLPMKVLKVSRPTGKQKWSIWVDGGIHAREFIAPHTVDYIIHQLVLGLEASDPEVLEFLDELDWYFLPVINVDGYEYCHTENRLWRKNRHPYTANCTGVDLNRNFDYMWGGVNSSPNPCETMFRGPTPLSEPETQNMAAFLSARKHLFKGFFSFHSYGMKWFTRWAYSIKVLPDDHPELLELALRATNATNSVHGMSYEAGTSAQILYPFSGGSADYARGVLGIKYPYLLELRDNGRYGFLLPENQSIPVGEEVWAGVKVVAKEIIQKYANENVESKMNTKYPLNEDDNIFTTYPHDDSADNMASTVPMPGDTQLSLTSANPDTPTSLSSPPPDTDQSKDNGASTNRITRHYYLLIFIGMLRTCASLCHERSFL